MPEGEGALFLTLRALHFDLADVLFLVVLGLFDLGLQDADIKDPALERQLFSSRVSVDGVRRPI